MNTPIDTLIDDCIEAARTDVADTALASARERFRATLPAPRVARSRPVTWVRWAGATAVLALVVSITPLLLPERLAGNSLALAQQWFERYTTLQLEMVTRQEGRALSRLAVWTDHTGATRVDVPPVSHVIDPANNEMRTVLPGGEVMRQPIAVDSDAFALGDHLEWLDELRDFQGLAEVVGQPRSLNGVHALGWSLELAGGHYVLWVDPADNRPLLLEATLPGGLSMETRFTFDEALPEDIFQPGPAASR